MRGTLLLLVLSPSTLAWGQAQLSVTNEQLAQLETLRAQVANQVQLQAYDLLDELVFGWSKTPLFAVDTPVVLADVTVPLGFGSGLQALIENHFAELVTKNPGTHIQLSHCPQCTSIIVHSGSKGTIISRGVDQPEALIKAGTDSSSRHALFLDFEAEGSSLVLRARLTSLAPTLPIIAARTLSSSTSTAALLRQSAHLKSAEDARAEYVEALQSRGVIQVPLRIGVRNYAPSIELGGIGIPPLVWLQAGAEVGLTQARAWTAGVTLGATWLPEVQTGWLVQARVSRLLSGAESSLTEPDIYGFFGGSLITIQGPGSLLFRSGLTPSISDIVLAAAGIGSPETLWGALQVGVELRVKNRIALAVFAEAAPTLTGAQAIGSYLNLGILNFQSIGGDVSFCF